MTGSVADFNPARHGFQFVNRFTQLPFASPLDRPLSRLGLFYGLCGGMCFAAADYYLAGAPIPPTPNIPQHDSVLYRYILRRQWDSWGRLNGQVLRYFGLMLVSRERAARISAAEWETARARLDSGQFAVLGLVYQPFSRSLRVWENHQVLASGYNIASDGTIRIQVYDPNWPARDDIEVVGLRAGDGRYWWEQRRAARPDRDVHGWFAVPYARRAPPLREI